MEKGKSFETFAAKVGVSAETLYRWCEVEPDFSEAKKRGRALQVAFWEDLYMENAVMGKELSGVPSLLIFGMKNVAQWTDRMAASNNVEGTSHVTLSYNLDEPEDTDEPIPSPGE